MRRDSWATLPVLVLSVAVPPADVEHPAMMRNDGSFVFAYDGDMLTTTRATGAPSSVVIREFTVVAGAGGGYEAMLVFDEPFRSLGTDHTTFISLRPDDPNAPRERVVLNGDGTATHDRAADNQFVAFEPADVRVDGAAVVFSLPPNVNVNWGVQAHVLWPTGGFHSHTFESSVGLFTGEPIAGPAIWLGYPLQNGQPVLFRLPAAVPEDLQIERVTVETDQLVVEFKRDLNAYLAAGAGISVTTALLGAPDAASHVWSLLDASPGVAATGNTVTFPFHPDAIVDVGNSFEFVSPATATATPETCGGAAVTFDVTVRIIDDVVSIEHADGDVASGPLDLEAGTGELTSPGGRTYELTSIAGSSITANHMYSGCGYLVEFLLGSPIPASSAVAGPTPTPTPDTLGGGVFDAQPGDFVLVTITYQADGVDYVAGGLAYAVP